MKKYSKEYFDELVEKLLSIIGIGVLSIFGLSMMIIFGKSLISILLK